MKKKRTGLLALFLALALLLSACAQETPAPVGNTPAPSPAETAEPAPPTPTPCAHVWRGGVCELCGEVCAHSWDGGVCGVCGAVCPHTSHDPESCLCPVCGARATHLYSESRCVRCGCEPPFLTKGLPEHYYGECPERGSVEEIDFHVLEDPKDFKLREKPAVVYLPYGYESAERPGPYNVVIALHGAGNNEHGMVDEQHASSGRTISLAQVYDWMLYEKRCEPFIVVSLNVYALAEEENFTDKGVALLAERLRTLVLPYVVEHYDTYAADASPEAMREARAHFAMLGVSNGSLYTLAAGIAGNLESFGNFGCFSGNYTETTSLMLRRLSAPDALELPIYCFFTGAGETDFQKKNTLKRYEVIVDNYPGLTDGANAFHLDVAGSHSWHSWTINIYDALLVMFQNRD